MVDMKGITFHEGCKVARAVLYGKSPMIYTEEHGEH